jgi:hypothetical protein
MQISTRVGVVQAIGVFSFQRGRVCPVEQYDGPAIRSNRNF